MAIISKKELRRQLMEYGYTKEKLVKMSWRDMVIALDYENYYHFING